MARRLRQRAALVVGSRRAGRLCRMGGGGGHVASVIVADRRSGKAVCRPHEVSGTGISRDLTVSERPSWSS